MSFSAVHGTLSSLKLCQTDILTGMNIVTDVAMDLAEAQGNFSSVAVLDVCDVAHRVLLVSVSVCLHCLFVIMGLLIHQCIRIAKT